MMHFEIKRCGRIGYMVYMVMDSGPLSRLPDGLPVDAAITRRGAQRLVKRRQRRLQRARGME
jgi:hypothetical protein